MKRDYRIIYVSYKENEKKWKRHTMVVSCDSILDAYYKGLERSMNRKEIGYHQNVISIKVVSHKRKAA